jgi:hypothetical protein
VHQSPTEQAAQNVGVIGQNDLGHLRLSAGDCTDGRVGRVRSLDGTHSTITPYAVRSVGEPVPGRSGSTIKRKVVVRSLVCRLRCEMYSSSFSN